MTSAWRPVVTVLLVIVSGVGSFGCSCEKTTEPEVTNRCTSSECKPDASADAGAVPDAAPDASADAAAPDAASPDADTALTAWQIWARTSAALQRSPDNLPGRAAQLVEQRDPAALHAFVRDQIATYPPTLNGMSNAETAMRWGTRATLRGGAGTPREKAELLVELYEAAGFEARVVRGPPAAGVTAEQILHRTFARPFEFDLSRAEIDRFSEALGFDMPHEVSLIDPTRVQTAELADALLPLLDQHRVAAFDFDLEQLPIVAVTVDGTETYANPLVPDAEFGESLLDVTPRDAAAAGALQRLRVTLEGARSDAPFERFTLIEHEFSADEVAGRRLQLGFSPVAPPGQAMVMRAADVEVFIPSIAVHAPDLSDDERQAMHYAGTPFSRGGDRFEVTDDGVTVNGETLGGGTTSEADLARVDSASAVASGSGFERVTVRVSARDSDGQRVAGLGADAFEVREDDVPVAFSLRQNQAPPPRVMLLFDTSTSLPDAFRGQGAIEFGQAVAARLFEEFPQTQLRVGVVNFGVDYADERWAQDLAGAETQLGWLDGQEHGSELWQATSEVNGEGPTLIVLVSDGDATDEAEPKYRSGIAAGAPVFVVAAADDVHDSLQTIADLSGGQANTVAGQQQAIDDVVQYIERTSAQDYQLAYTAPTDGASERQVQVLIDSGRVEASTSYRVPETTQPVSRLSGLYLTVEVDGRSFTRPIAGLTRAPTSEHVEITEAMLQDVEETLLGRVVLSVEGAPPGLSTLISDHLLEKLRFEALYDAVLEEDRDAAEAAAARGAFLTPLPLLMMNTPLSADGNDDSLTFEASMRVTSFIRRPRWERGFEESIDVFPLTRYRTTLQDPDAAFQATVERSAYLAVAEAAHYPANTLTLLDGATLQRVPSGSVSTQLTDLDVEARSRLTAVTESFGSTYSLLIPESDDPAAFWAIDEETGTLIGMLPDGSGGSRGEIEAELARTKVLLHQVQQVGGVIAVWAHIAEIEAELVARATILIATGEDPGDWTDPFLGYPCGAARSLALGLAPGGAALDDALSIVEDATAATGIAPGASFPPALPGCP